MSVICRGGRKILDKREQPNGGKTPGELGRRLRLAAMATMGAVSLRQTGRRGRSTGSEPMPKQMGRRDVQAGSRGKRARRGGSHKKPGKQQKRGTPKGGGDGGTKPYIQNLLLTVPMYKTTEIYHRAMLFKRTVIWSLVGIALVTFMHRNNCAEILLFS